MTSIIDFTPGRFIYELCKNVRFLFILEKPAQRPLLWKQKLKKIIQPPPEKPPEVNRAKVSRLYSNLFLGKPNRYTIGCVLPFPDLMQLEGSRGLDAILLAAGIFDQASKTPWKVLPRIPRSTGRSKRSYSASGQ